MKAKVPNPTDEFLEYLSEFEGEKLYPTEHKDAIVGIVERFGMNPIIVLDKMKIIRKLVRDGMTEEEAEEFFSFNIVGAWMGEGTPAFVTFTKDVLMRR